MARIILGGDHLGPNPWKSLPASEAMAKAKAMVEAYVRAGFGKIHLDASMALGSDGSLSEETMAERAAELCAVAEAARGDHELAYVIGTEVPIPGGETESLDSLAVTTPRAVQRTYELHRAQFASGAFERVTAMVVQPGVDFGNAQVFAFEPAKAAALAQSIAQVPSAVFEAHSTDYQSEAALAGLVAGHFAILKVGPELTFAFREAVVAMSEIEQWLNIATPSNILRVISEVMDADPRHWQNYMDAGDETMKLFGLSDRIRYYWPNSRIAAALRKLRENIDTTPIAPGLVSQYVGALDSQHKNLPLTEQIIQSKVGAIVNKYRRACDASGSFASPERSSGEGARQGG
jgi:D-tagatose-1,6-bisphosphate aldolase subunit GatZ/KbaZ